MSMHETCARCGASCSTGSIMSKFNADTICFACKDAERKHPQYAEADAAEVAAVRRGDYNFAGIGCPPDLYVSAPRGDRVPTAEDELDAAVTVLVIGEDA